MEMDMRELTGSETLYGFAGWLTTRREVTRMSASHDCAGIPDLIQEFCEANGLSEPKEDWHEILIHPLPTER